MNWGERVRGREIEPSIYAADFAALGAQLQSLLAGGARIFHFDVGDGHFVEPVTIGPIVLESIAGLVHAGGGSFDCHLMVDNPERQFPLIARAGGDSVTFHVETTLDPARTAAAARALGLGVGLAFNPETPVSAAAAAAAVAHVDLALCMTIHPGYSGQELLEESYARVAELRRLLPVGVLVQVDGGVKLANASRLREAGADLLVAGSSVFGAPEPAHAYRELAAAVA